MFVEEIHLLPTAAWGTLHRHEKGPATSVLPHDQTVSLTRENKEKGDKRFVDNIRTLVLVLHTVLQRRCKYRVPYLWFVRPVKVCRLSVQRIVWVGLIEQVNETIDNCVNVQHRFPIFT